VYISEQDGCITNNEGDEYHSWRRVEDVQSYFKPLKDVDRMYTEATDRLRELHRNFTGDKIGDPDKADYFDNKDSNHGYFSFSAQWGLEEFYKEVGYDYVSEEVFIKLNGLEEKTYEEDPYSWVNNGIREAESRKGVRDFKSITDSIADLLEYKNTKYGNAVLEPLQIFSGKCKAGTRLDDKLGRIKNSGELRKNDVADLIGYLILTCKENNWTDFSEFKD